MARKQRPDRDGDGTGPLTTKEERFVELFLVSLNAASAYAEAFAVRGGPTSATARTNASRLMKLPRVATAIEAAKAKRVERVEVDQDYALENLREVVERCMQRAPVMVRQGRHMVQATEDGRHVWQFDARGVVAACRLLGLHLGMFVEKRALVGGDGGPIQVRVSISREGKRSTAG